MTKWAVQEKTNFIQSDGIIVNNASHSHNEIFQRLIKFHATVKMSKFFDTTCRKISYTMRTKVLQTSAYQQNLHKAIEELRGKTA